MATDTGHSDPPLTEMDFESPIFNSSENTKEDEMETVTSIEDSELPTLVPYEMKKDEIDTVNVVAEQEKEGHPDTTLTEMDFQSPPLSPREGEKEDAAEAVALTKMDLAPSTFTQKEMKKNEMDAVNVSAEQKNAAEIELVQEKFIDLGTAGDEQLDAIKSFPPEVKLDDILIKDLYVKFRDGKKRPFHEKKNRECEDCHLGGGSFGEVFKAVHGFHEVAVKVAKPGKEDQLTMYQKEAEKHVAALTSKQIVGIRGFVQCDYDECRCGLVGIVMEYMERGSLWNFRSNEWEKDHPDIWSLTNRMVYQISLGMHYLHSKTEPIIHRDLKLENVLLDVNLNAKIADLGLATRPTSSGDICCGTNSHMPPEAFRKDFTTKVVTIKYDVYSFAMTLYELLTGIHPYSERQFDMMRLLKVEAKQAPPLDSLPENTPRDLQQIMEDSWSYEPDDRPDFTEITERVGALDTDPPPESVVHLGKSRSSKKGKKAESPLAKPDVGTEKIGNLTVQKQAPVKEQGNTSSSLPAGKAVNDRESLSRKMENLTVNADAQTELRTKKETIPVPETLVQHVVEGQQSVPTHRGQDAVVAQPVRHENEPNPSQSAPLSHQVLRRPHDSSVGRPPKPATGAVSQDFTGDWYQSGAAGYCPNEDDAQPGSERAVPLGPSPEPRFKSLKSRPESEESMQTPVGASQSMQFKGIESTPTTNPPGPSANTSLRSYTEHDKVLAGGQGHKYGYNNSSIAAESKHLKPSPYGHNSPASDLGERRPVPVDGHHGTTEYAVSPLPAGPIHQESHAAESSQPNSASSSVERDLVVSFDSSQATDDDFEIKLHVDVTIPTRASIAEKLQEILSCHKRCKQPAYWQNSDSLCTTLESHEFTLLMLQLPPTVEEDSFTLFLRVSNKAFLEKLWKFWKEGRLSKLLFPHFVDRQLVDICSPVKPDLKIKPWEDQFNKGMEHFKKKEKAKSNSKKAKKGTRGNGKTTVQTTGDGTTQIDKGNVHMNIRGGVQQIIVGDQTNHYHYGARGAGAGLQDIPGIPPSPHQKQEKPEEPKLCGSREKVGRSLLLDISERILEKDVKSLGRHLNLNDVEVGNIIYSHRGERSSEIAYQVLNEWMQRNGQHATKAVLAQALWKAKCYDAARSVR